MAHIEAGLFYWRCDKCDGIVMKELFACPVCGGRLSAGWSDGEELHWPPETELDEPLPSSDDWVYN